ncbi:MAG: hypothetical protein HS119_06505 [Flavobacteriales bacterium]|nr:hypothetical protein [Flavobacteriales bacterium]
MEKIEKTQIVDNSYFSIGFPEKKWDELISRENIISKIEDSFNTCSLIYIEGEEDSGKTTLSAQFTKKNIKNTISVFFNPLNNLDYQKEFYCTNFVNQVRNILKDETVISDWENLVSIEEHQKIEFQLRKRYKNKNEKIYLVVDGLGDVINEKPDFVKSILSIMPIGQDFFRIILTGSKKDFEKLDINLKKLRHTILVSMGSQKQN